MTERLELDLLHSDKQLLEQEKHKTENPPNPKLYKTAGSNHGMVSNAGLYYLWEAKCKDDVHIQSSFLPEDIFHIHGASRQTPSRV